MHRNGAWNGWCVNEYWHCRCNESGEDGAGHETCSGSGTKCIFCRPHAEETLCNCQFPNFRCLPSCMNSHDPIDKLHQKLEELTALRQQEEEEYGKLLTLLDQRW